jgi:hypothetical protein
MQQHRPVILKRYTGKSRLWLRRKLGEKAAKRGTNTKRQNAKEFLRP